MSLAFFTNSQVNHGFNWLWQFPKCSSRSIEVGEATMLRQLEWCWPWKVEASFCKVKSCCWRQTINGSGGCVNYVLFFPLIVKGQNSTKIAHRSIIHDDAIWRNFLRQISCIVWQREIEEIGTTKFDYSFRRELTSFFTILSKCQKSKYDYYEDNKMTDLSSSWLILLG